MYNTRSLKQPFPEPPPVEKTQPPTGEQAQYRVAVAQLTDTIHMLEDSINRAIDLSSRFLVCDPRQPVPVKSTGDNELCDISKSPATKEIESITCRAYTLFEMTQRFGSFIDN